MGGWLLVLAGTGLWVGILLQGLAARTPTIRHGLSIVVAGACVLVLGSTARLLFPGQGGTSLGRGGASTGRSSRVVIGLAVLVGFGLLGAGWSEVHDARIRGSPVALFVGHAVRAWGSLDADPEPATIGWSASVRTEILFARDPRFPPALRSSSRLWLSGSGPVPALTGGDRVEVDGLVSIPDGAFGSFLRQHGYAGSLRTTALRYRGPPSNPFLRAANAIRTALRDSLRKVLPPREAGLVMGLALGDTSSLDLDTEDEFRATGLSHLVAVSGANVAMFLAPILGLMAWGGVGVRGRAVVGVASVAFFVLLTRAEPSVMRAGVMTGLAMLGVFLGRPKSPTAIVGGSVLGLLTLDPSLAYSIGFQLSVAATAGMIVMAGPIADRLRFVPNGVALAAGATLGAQAGVTPLLLFHFGVVPTVTLPANLLAFPAVSPAMLLGLAAGLGGLAWPPLGLLLGGLARLPLSYLEGVAARLARFPLPSITSPGGQVWALVIGVVAVTLVAWWIRSGRGVPRRAATAMCVALPLFLWASALRASNPGSLTVTFFDVGQGDAALVRSPAGASILIDGGPEEFTVARKLAGLGIRRIDLLVATHPHADHLDGLPAVLRRFRVALVVDSGCGGDSPYYKTFAQAVESSGVPFRHPPEGTTLMVGDVRLEVLGPDRCYHGTNSDPNNDSMVLRVARGSATVLFPGDAEEPSQQQLLLHHASALRAVVLKVPHHGGATTLEEFFDAADARVAVVSVGPNLYGHPVAAVLEELRDGGAAVFRTDRSGDVTVTFSGSDVLIESVRA